MYSASEDLYHSIYCYLQQSSCLLDRFDETVQLKFRQVKKQLARAKHSTMLADNMHQEAFLVTHLLLYQDRKLMQSKAACKVYI